MRSQICRLKSSAMTSKNLGGAISAATAAFLVLSGHALAQESADQDVSPNISVADRFDLNTGADGIKAGGFTLFPTLSYIQIYDDNIFGEETMPTDDFIGDIRGGLRLRSNWSVHGIELYGVAERLEYFDNKDESTTDYAFGARTFLDFASRSRVILSASHEQGTEARRVTQTAVGGVKPVQYETERAAIDFDLLQNRFREQFGVSFRRDNYDDVALSGGGGFIDQDFRDRDVYAAYFRQLFRVRPAVSLFVQVDGEIQEYDFAQPVFGLKQDSQSYRAQMGVAFDINKVARGEIGVGYQNRDFDDPAFGDVSGISVGAEFEYFMSDLTTITINADRSIRDTAVLGVAGYYSNGGGITIEHELFRPLMLVGEAAYRVDDFRGIDRQDDVLRLSAGLDYAFRRNVVATLRYIRLDVGSDGAAARAGFEENIVRFGIELKL